jgi:transcription factor IIIB subunit 2
MNLSKDSRELTIANGRRRIAEVSALLNLNQSFIEFAHRLFKLAVGINFIQGRKTIHVVATCLYVACRQKKSPHLLIDFSDTLQTDVYVLGSCFLKLTRLLNLKMPLIDPSLFIHRFASKLEFADKTQTVALTAQRLVARMSRDWIQLGRRPSGLCGAALLIAARTHGFKRSQKEVAAIVQVNDMTIRQRLVEFGETPAGSMTLEEFERESLQIERKKLVPIAMDPPSFRRNKINEVFEARIRSGNVDSPVQSAEAGALTSIPPPPTEPNPNADAEDISSGSSLPAEGNGSGGGTTKPVSGGNGRADTLSQPVAGSDELDSEQRAILAKKLRDFEKSGKHREERRNLYSFIEKTMIDDAEESAMLKTEYRESMKAKEEAQAVSANAAAKRPLEDEPGPKDTDADTEEVAEKVAEKDSEKGAETAQPESKTASGAVVEKGSDAVTSGDGVLPKLEGSDVPSAAAVEAQSLSDVDDDELDDLFLNDSEVEKKTSIWMGMHSEYLAQKAEKRRHDEIMGKNNPTKGTKKRKKKSAGEAAKDHLEQRRISTKLNYAALAFLSGPSETDDKKDALKRSSTGSRGKVMAGSRIHDNKAKAAAQAPSGTLPSAGSLSKTILDSQKAKTTTERLCSFYSFICTSVQSSTIHTLALTNFCYASHLRPFKTLLVVPKITKVKFGL